jgi:riboflavin kinase/FMN adenylyltransferase
VETQHLRLSIECHILDFEGDLYGKKIKIIFYDFLRDEKKFLSIGELTEQIRMDVKKCKDYSYES